MTDPISGQVASQAVEAMAQQSGERGSSVSPVSEADFADVIGEGDKAEDIDQSDDIDAIDAIEAVDEVDELEPASEISTDDFIQRLLEEESSIQSMMENCLNGGELGQQEMLQMQAVIYSYSQRVDLTTKVVENATSGIKQVMNTQV